MIAHVLPRRETSNAVGHFLLVLQIDDRSVRYIEPNYAASIETVPRSQFVRCWSGYLILPESRKMSSQRSATFVLWGVIAASVSIGSFPLARWVLRHRPVFWWRRVKSLAGLLVSCVTLGCTALPANVSLSVEQSASSVDGIVARPASPDALRLIAWNTDADLGVLPRDGAAEGLFRIENQGNSTVRLHLGSPTCRCSEARLEQETLVAGASTNVHMIMRSRPRQAGPADARVYIEAEGGAWAEALECPCDRTRRATFPITRTWSAALPRSREPHRLSAACFSRHRRASQRLTCRWAGPAGNPYSSSRTSALGRPSTFQATCGESARSRSESIRKTTSLESGKT